jgi:hypothetical protein
LTVLPFAEFVIVTVVSLPPVTLTTTGVFGLTLTLPLLPAVTLTFAAGAEGLVLVAPAPADPLTPGEHALSPNATTASPTTPTDLQRRWRSTLDRKCI